MTDITLSTSSTTQTLVGDNGVSTDATFTANALDNANWGRTGVGLAGSDYDPSGEAALEVSFTNAVQDFQFTLFDVDQATTTWDDQIRVEAYDLYGNPIPITFTTTSTGHVVEEDGTDGVLQIEASNNDDDNQSSIVVTIAGPVGSVKIYHEDGTDATNNSGLINLESMSFTNALDSDGTVSGTAGDDEINALYNDDPDGDFVDNDDAILSGDTGDDDLIEANEGNDTVFAGDGDDVVLGGADNDTIYGQDDNDLLIGDQTVSGAGLDTIYGGEGNDTIYGDTAAADVIADTYPTVFSWADQAEADEADLTAGLEGTTTNGAVQVTLSTEQETNFTSISMEKDDPLYDYDDVSDTSSIEVFGGSAGTDQNAATVTLTFDPAVGGYSDEVEDVTFGIFDLDEADGQFIDQVIIRAYDADGNLVSVTITPGDTDTITASTAADGIATATAVVNSNGGGSTTSETGFIEVSVAGPVSYIEIDYNNIDPDFGNHAIRIGDISLTAIADEPADGDDDVLYGDDGDDTIFGQEGDDTITGGADNDTLFGGDGNDAFQIAEADGTDTITGGEDTDGSDIDTVSFETVGNTDSVNVTFTGDEAGNYQVGGSGSDGDFTEIERIVGTDNDDTVDLSGDNAGITVEAGAGNDTVTTGQGADVINAGDGQDDILIGDDFGDDDIDGGSVADDTGDVLDGSSLTQDVTVDFSAAETGTIDNGSDVLDFTEIETIITGSGDDTIQGGVGSDTVSTGAGEDEITFGYGDNVDAGDDDDVLTLATQGPSSNGTITIDGGDEIRDINGDLVGNGDVLDLGDLADLSTLITTTDADGSLSGSVELDDGTLLNFTDIEEIICFTPGTSIATPLGTRAIETLQVGDMVVTRDHGLQPIRWIQSRTVEAKGKFAPVRIRPGAVTGLEKDMLVSPQHRMLFTGYRSELLFGEREVLMPAIHLVDNKLVTRETGGTVTYIHMMFDSHEVVYADGAASENFHPGEQGMYGITPLAREELFALFPELRTNAKGFGPAARRCLKKHETQMLRVS